MIDTLLSILSSEFFWGIVVGAILTAIGAWLVVRLQERSQRKQRFELVRTFSIDTLQNISQIIRDLGDLRARTSAIQHDFLAVLQVELDVFSRNREHIIFLPPKVRAPLREFINNCAIRRAEIANFLTEFYQQNALAAQLASSTTSPQTNALQAQQALQRANAAADRLEQLRLSDVDNLIAQLRSARVP